MWANQDKKCLFTGLLLPIYALTLLSFQLQHVHRYWWSNQLDITFAAFSACNTYELYQACKDRIWPQNGRKQNSENLKKQTVVWIKQKHSF